MLKARTEYSQSQIDQVRAASPAFALYQNPAQGLQGERNKAWSECVLATFYQTAGAEEICRHWSATADRLLLQGWRQAGLHEEPAALFALGKLGSSELNLSSDVDLILVAAPEAAASVQKKFRQFRQDCPFRLDFDLRPGGTMGPIITTPSQFQDYYWSQGEAWERLALVRIRLLTEQNEISANILDLADRFCFRKFLDYTLLEDLKALRSQIHRAGFDRQPDQTHLKLEVGGIRDIELFLHSLQVLNGGKIPELKERSTSIAAEKLTMQKILPAADGRLLMETYWHYRQLENQVQAFEDHQTHTINWEKLPAGWNWPTRDKLQKKLDAVDKIVSGLLGRVDITAPQLPGELGAQEAWLQKLGYSEEAVHAAWPQLIKATALSYKNDRDERARRQFLYTFIEKMSSLGQDHNLGLHLLCDFVRATRAKATFFSLLLREPRLIDDLARMFCLSPYLGAILSARPELLDNFILQRDEEWHKDLSAFLEQASEKKLLQELRSANYFLAAFDLNGLLMQTSLTADEIGLELLDRVKADTASTQLHILTLGKWGGREMGLRSDLDFIFVTSGPPAEPDLRAAKRFISRLTDPQKGGALYGMDLRLRPSGQSGPILLSLEQLEKYWRNDARAWERQAYLRMRPLGPDLKVDGSSLLSRGLNAEEMNELREIRGKLLKKPSEDGIDLKYCPGGLVDIEFTGQILALEKKSRVPPNTLQMLEQLKMAGKLSAAYTFLRTLEQLLQLSASHAVTLAEFNSEVFQRACRLWKKSAASVREELEHHLEVSRDILNAADVTGFRR